jgi:hypothetical protein
MGKNKQSAASTYSIVYRIMSNGAGRGAETTISSSEYGLDGKK